MRRPRGERMLERCAKPNRLVLLGFALLNGLLIVAFGAVAQQQPAATAQATSPATQAVPPVPAQPGPPQEAEAPQTLHLLDGRSLLISSPTRIQRISLADPN